MDNKGNSSSSGKTDQRKHPRIALALPITIIGFNATARVVDFSLGGFHIATDNTEQFKQGQQIRIAVRFPDEAAISFIKASIAHIGQKGLGCRLIDVDPAIYRMLESNFDFYRSTMPIE
ncbi:PilZ domain-containing protein [Desulfatitalea alkaliphila]|uniref:PilZ domain-containing protein n=1 Tax=Desulfatitalea alkaliphila TaxID=2929485 RepID=A0AA41R317_9BACT|nr:PilZ domain-containing protein [Desulfatitalea alkaliphila]MCJ8499796.1 PilZ domain-containing protein [Desulfatitalea alkaliphila]